MRRPLVTFWVQASIDYGNGRVHEAEGSGYMTIEDFYDAMEKENARLIPPVCGEDKELLYETQMVGGRKKFYEIELYTPNIEIPK